MKIIKQGLIIFTFTLLGILIHDWINIPLPSSVIGLGLMYLALSLKIIKIEDVETVGTFLKDNMTIMFIPLTVAVMDVFDIIKLNLFELVIIMVISTTVTMIGVGLFGDFLRKRGKKL